jgi:antitoxin VapB
MTTAKLFQNGRSQAVRLPREFRFSGNEVSIRRFGLGILLSPVAISSDDWFRALDRFTEPFMPEGRSQPAAQARDSLD